MGSSSNFIVFDASGGVGSTLSRRLSDAGHSLFLAGRDRDKTERLAKELRAPFSTCDATEADSVVDCFRRAGEEFESIDGVAHCVGSLLIKPANLNTPVEWSDTIPANLTSAFYVLRAAASPMRKHGGSIVFVSSAAVRIGLANHEAVAAAKAGLIGLTISAAATYGAQGIRVNCVAPGLVDTPLTSRITSNERAAQFRRGIHSSKHRLA